MLNDNTHSKINSLLPVNLHKSNSRNIKPVHKRCHKLPIALSVLFALVLHPLFATGAEDPAGDNQPDAYVEQAITPEQELITKLESMKSMRIVMHAREPAQRLADQLQSLLSAMGVTEIEKRIVDEVPDSNQVRYYHPADKEAGQVVGEALSLVFDEVAVRNFEDYQPAPADGLIEIWLR